MLCFASASVFGNNGASFRLEPGPNYTNVGIDPPTRSCLARAPTRTGHFANATTHHATNCGGCLRPVPSVRFAGAVLMRALNKRRLCVPTACVEHARRQVHQRLGSGVMGRDALCARSLVAVAIPLAMQRCGREARREEH